VPRFVLERPKKGFATPTATWLRTGLHARLHDALFDSRSFTRDHFDLRYVRALVERHEKGADLSSELWPLLILELWRSQLSQRSQPRKEPRHAAS
jgi:asparagine synthase (glutamine-hydrolysing)